MPAAIGTIPELFRSQVQRTPAELAVADTGLTLTYRQLADHVHRLAHRLVAAGIRPGDLVGLRAAPSADRVVAMLAIMQAGAAYVPLEANLPDERLRLICADARARAVLTIPPLRWRQPAADTITYSLGDNATRAFPDWAPSVNVEPDDLMYVPYTSGSTGSPKGVLVPHRSVPGVFLGENYVDWGPGSRVLLHSPMAWDGHVLELYPTLLTGGTVLIHRGDARNPIDVARYARQLHCTLLLLATQAFNTVAAEDPDALAGLDCLLIGGETASVDHVSTVMSRHPRLRIVNVYGPVECTCLATARPIEPADLGRPAVPVGRLVGDRRIYLLDEDSSTVAEGNVGEAYVGGPAVATGYLNRPALTAERFVPDPFSGIPGARLYRTGDRLWHSAVGYDFAGRIDDQVKLRGLRIEPGEVSAVLRTHSAVRDAATVVTSGPAGPALRSYVVPDGRHVPGLRAYLAERLPEAMVPATIAGIDRLPTTDSGKLDRLALAARPPEPAAAPAGGAEPLGSTERTLSGIWERLLNVPAFRRSDDFFELGGHSLLAARLALAVERELDVKVQLRDVYDHPILSEMADLIDLRRPPLR